MPSQTYSAILAAMHNQQQITCVYQGRLREMCPHTIGWKNGREKVLGFQFAGESSKGLPPGGEWRCMFVEEITDLGTREGPWHTRDDHLRPQTCIDDVEYEVIA